MKFGGYNCIKWGKWVRKKRAFLSVFSRFYAFICKNIDLYSFIAKNTRFFALFFSDSLANK